MLKTWKEIEKLFEEDIESGKKYILSVHNKREAAKLWSEFATNSTFLSQNLSKLKSDRVFAKSITNLILWDLKKMTYQKTK